MKTAISVPDPVFQAAEELADRLGMSRSRLYSTAVAEYVESHRGSDVTEALNLVYSDQEAVLDPVLEQLQQRALAREEW